MTNPKINIILNHNREIVREHAFFELKEDKITNNKDDITNTKTIDQKKMDANNNKI